VSDFEPIPLRKEHFKPKSFDVGVWYVVIEMSIISMDGTTIALHHFMTPLETAVLLGLNPSEKQHSATELRIQLSDAPTSGVLSLRYWSVRMDTP
jgi:hypothetical protein